MNDEIIGKQFGYLTVTKQVDSNKNNQICYECLCDCGNTTIVTKNHLVTGHTKSCGCYKGRMCSSANFKHGQAGKRLYNTYYHMKRRCFNLKDKEYHRYGGRGITVCDEWLGKNGFENFYSWAMNSGYQDNLSIDRIDNNKNYEPSNCRWATPEQQMNNVNYNVRLTYNGETHTIAEWSRIIGIDQDTIQSRIKYYNMPVEKALFKSPTSKKRVAIYKDGCLINIFDSQKEAAEFVGVHTSQMSQYLHNKVNSLNGYTAKRIVEDYKNDSEECVG